MNIILSNQCSSSNRRSLYSLLDEKESDDDGELLISNSQFIGRGDIGMKDIYRGFFITNSKFIYILKNYSYPLIQTPEIKYIYSYSTIYHDNTSIYFFIIIYLSRKSN